MFSSRSYAPFGGGVVIYNVEEMRQEDCLLFLRVRGWKDVGGCDGER